MMANDTDFLSRRQSMSRHWTRVVKLEADTADKLAAATAYFEKPHPAMEGLDGAADVSSAMTKLLIRRRSQATVNPFVRRRSSHMRIEDITTRGKRFKNAALLALEIERLNQAKQRLELPTVAASPSCENLETFPEETESVAAPKRRRRLQSFRKAARAILIVIQACNAVREILSTRVKSERWMLVMDNILLNASRSRGRREVFVAKYTDENSHDLVEVSFDANKFRRDFVSEDLLAGPTRVALERSPDARTREEVRKIVRCMRCISIEFRRYTHDIQWRICQVAFFDKFATNRVIIKQGLPPDGFYFVLMGTVAEHSPERRMPRDHNVGSKFGEQDLICGSHRRTTAVARTYVELLYVHRLDYGRIFNLSGNSSDSTDLNICLNNPVFSHFPIDRFIENPGTWNVVPFKVGQLIAEDSNRVDWIYIVKHGQARIIRTMKTRYVEMSKLNRPEPHETATMRLLQFQSEPGPNSEISRLNRVSTAKSSRSCPPVFEAYSDKSSESASQIEKNSSGKFPVTSTRPKTSAGRTKASELIQVPSFLQLEQLGPGQAFGLRSCLEEEERGPSVSLVSAGCTLLLINRRFFSNHLDTFMLGMIRLYTKPYPSEPELIRNLNTVLKWEEYKGNMLRCSMSELYARKKAKTAMGFLERA